LPCPQHAKAAAVPGGADVPNDYSLDPAFAGRRVELRVSQTQVTAVVLDSGELACRHRRVFAGDLTITEPQHQRQLDRLRGRRVGRDVEVETRPLALRYSPTTSRTLSINCGSGESLNASVWCGLNPKARQIRLTALWLIPVAAASERVDQCVASRGCSSSVFTLKTN
jgi:hypothetical protein